MRFRFLPVIFSFLTASCSAGDKHLPSSNPPEYDTKKVHTAPASTVFAPSQSVLGGSYGAGGISPGGEGGGGLSAGEGSRAGKGSGSIGGSREGSGGVGRRESSHSAGAASTRPSYVLEFISHIVQGPLNIVHPQFGMQSSSNGFDAHVQAIVPIRHTEDRGWVREGPMRYETRTTTQAAQCEIRVQGHGTTTLSVKSGAISCAPEPFAVSLTILPGPTGERAETHCSSGATPDKLRELLAAQGGEAQGVSTKGGGWTAAFNVTRFTRFNTTKGGYEIGGWTPVRDSDVIAKKTMTVNCSFNPMQSCQEVTELVSKEVRVAE